MPRPEGYASLQFEQVESTGKQVMVECRHCKNKRLARSVASRKLKHLQQCADFNRYLAELATSNDEQLNDVPVELLHGPQRRTQSSGASYGGDVSGYTAQQTPLQRAQFDVSLPTLLDGLGGRRRDPDSEPLDDIHDWNRAGLETDTPMDEAPTTTTTTSTSTSDPTPTTTTTTPQTAPLHPLPRFQPPDSVPERAIAHAHRAAQRRKEKLDNVLTRAIFQGSLPFNIQDGAKHPAMAEFFKLVDYVPPDRHRIADDVYDHTHDQSDEIIAYAS